MFQPVDEIRQPLLRHFVDRQFDTQFACLRYRQALIATGVDTGKRRQVHIHIQRQTMIAAATPDAQTQCGELGSINVHTGRIGA